MGKSVRSNNPLVLGADDSDQIPVKKQPQQQQGNPLVLGAEDSKFVKKKAGGDGSASDTSHTPSESPEQAAKAFQDKTLTKQSVDVLADTDAGKKAGLNNMSPDAREVFAQAHNGPKKADLVSSVSGILNDFYPQTPDPAQNKKTFNLKQSVLQGNQEAIIGTRDTIIQGLQKKIDQRKNEIFRPMPGTLGARQYSEALMEADPTVQELKSQQKKVTNSFDEYGKQSLVSSTDMEAWLKLDAEHPNIRTSIAAEKLGKQVEEKYGAERQTPNKEHDRMATGFRLIMEGLQMDVNEALSYGIPTKNPELLKKAQDKIATLARYRDMYNNLDTEQFPDVGLDKTARFLGDIIAEKHPNKLIRTAADVREAGKIANERNPGFMDKYGQFVETAAQKQDQGTFIPRGGGVINELVGGVVSASARNALDLLKWKARALPLSDTDKTDLSRETSPGMRGTTQSRTETTKITYDKEGKAYREMPNENYSTLPWNNFFRFAGESAPGLAEFIASEGVGKVAGEAFSLGRMGEKTKQLAGLTGAVYLTSYNSNREFADANIDDKTSTGEAKKIVLANLLTMANAGVFHALGASPSKLVEKAISKAVAPDVLEVLEKNSWEQLSQKAAETLLKDKILPRAKAIVQKFGENLEGGAKMGSASVIDQKIHDLAGVMTNTNYKPSTVEDNARAFVQQALLMTVVGLPGMVASGAMPHTTREALHEAGLYGPQYVEQINEKVQNGELDPIKANGMIAVVKTMHEELGKASKELNDDGTPLTIHQQRDLAIANFRKRAAVAMEEQGLPVSKEGVESESDKDIKNIKQQNNWQNIEDTPVFKSIKEVGESGGKGEKVKSMDDIDPTKEYTYEKEEGKEPVTTNGAELINHLETGDIYEKEKPDNKKASDQKAENTETKSKDAKSKEKVVVDKDEALKSVKAWDKEGDAWDTLRPKKPPKTIEDIEPEGWYSWGDKDSRKEGTGAELLNYLKGESDSETTDYKPNIRDDYFAKADFFTPEEKTKFETLGDTEKDKMIDDKRAELSSKEPVKKESVPDATAVVDGAIKEGKIADNLVEHVQKDPESFLKEVADQSLGYMRGSEGERIKSDLPGAEQAARDQYGDKVVDAAIKMFPEEAPAVKEEPVDKEANANIANHLQASYDRLIAAGTDPSDPEMKRLQERIESLSPKTETHGNEQAVEVGGSQKEGVPEDQEGGQKSEGPDKKGDVLTPESEAGAAKPPEDKSAPTPESNSPIVGIRDSIVNSERIHKGLQPLVKEFVRSWGSNWNELKRNIRNGFSPRQFIEETATRIGKGERVTFSDYDYATLLFDRLDIQNNIARATDALTEAVKKEGDSTQPNLSSLGERTAAQDLLNHYNAQLEQNDIIGRALKSESGRSLSAIQMMTSMNGELLKWSADISQYYNGHVPEAIKKFVERIEKEYKEKNEQLRAHYEERLKEAAEQAFKEAKKASPSTKAPGKKSVKAAGKDLADRIRALRPKSDGNLQASIFGLPIAVYDTALVAIANAVEAGASLVDAIQGALKDVKFDKDEDRNKFMSHLQNTEDPERPEARQDSLIQDIKSIARENDATNLVPDAVKPLRDLMKSYVQNGDVKTLDELVNKTHESLKDAMPDMEERDIRDAFSGHGMNPDSEGKIKSELTKLKEQAMAVSQYQDMLERPDGETKAQEQKRLTKAAELYKKVQSYMREMGIDEKPAPTTTEGKKALALEQAKKRTQTVINDLNRQILEGERKDRNNVEPDHDLSILRAERKRLSDQLDQIDKANISPEEQIKQIEDTLNRQISNYERQIREGLDPLKPKQDRPSTKQIEELRKRKKELKNQVEGLRNEADPRNDPKQKALAKYNESLARQIGKLDEKIENKNYESDTKPPVDFTRDSVSLALEARLKKLQSDFYATKRAGEAVNKRWIQKAMTFAAGLKRAFVLSRISTFGRLGAAVGWTNVFEPSGEATSGSATYALSKIGFGKNINKIAERYGVPTLGALGTMWKAEGDALKALGSPQTWKDFVSDAKNGYSELSLLYGHGNEAIPKEARDTWMNIQHGMEAFGRAHGAVKGISKRMEFMRSYAIRKEALKRKGEDVNNPVIQQSIGAMAYQDALRNILMEDNIVSEKYQKAIHELQKGGFGANVLALTLQEMMPIVKIPTNLVLNAGRSTLGTPLSGGAIAVRGLIDIISKGKSEYGISKLSAPEADAILRNLRKGNVGMALMLGGFFAPNMFGAAHYYKKGTDQPEGLEEGEVKFFGLTVPKWLADNPYLVTMKIGSSLRNAFDYYTDQEGVEAPQAAVHAFVETAIDALKETPILGTPSELIKAAEGYGGNWFWYSQVKGTLEPGILQEIAEDTDNREGWSDVFMGTRIKRKPQSVGESLKTGIPGLRQDVEEK